MRVLMGSVNHSVKVTNLGPGKGYGVRVYLDGVLNQEDVAKTKQDIGPVARSMLRTEDTCGNISKYADNARHRTTRKELSLKGIIYEHD